MCLFSIGGFQVVEADHESGWNHLNILLNGMTQILTRSGTRTTVEIVQCYGFFTNVRVSPVNLWVDFSFILLIINVDVLD